MGMSARTIVICFFAVTAAAATARMTMAMAIPSSVAADQLELYRPDKTLMIAKKSATALNKLMIALRSYEKTSSEKGNGIDSMDLGKSSPLYDTVGNGSKLTPGSKMDLSGSGNKLSFV